MSYDEELDVRIMEIAAPWGSERKRMFGGTGHMLHGHMMVGVHKDRLILRLGEQAGGPLPIPVGCMSCLFATGHPVFRQLPLDSRGSLAVNAPHHQRGVRPAETERIG